jgi:hypothetical protein
MDSHPNFGAGWIMSDSTGAFGTSAVAERDPRSKVRVQMAEPKESAEKLLLEGVHRRLGKRETAPTSGFRKLRR